MVVQHNLTAMNSNRMLGITAKTQAKATEKLSSGYKINRAADDAAGLSISEKMRKQIRGLTQASANAQDGISAVQTAEGALTEVHDMLQRMNELAVKAANGTNSKDDRDYIQAEVNQLVTEIDRVATTTKFNESYLLKGTNTDANGGVGALSFGVAKAGLSLSNDFDSDGIQTLTATTGDGAIVAADAAGKSTVKEATGDDVTASSFKQSVVKIGTGDSEMNYVLVHDFTAGTKQKTTIDDVVKGFDNTANAKYKAFSSVSAMEAAIRTDWGKDLKDVDIDTTLANNGTVSKVEAKITAFADLNKGLDVSLHVGADSTKDNKINLTIEMMSARGLGVNGIRVDGEDFDNATASIDTIKAAIQKVSEQRSNLGAVQNRLEHTINNLDNVVENTTSAESAIRDTDMAKQMVTYSNNNILAQAGQAMLAQANQSNQGVLGLLR